MGQWVIGLDTLSRHTGAVEFASWWREQQDTETRPRFVGVHVHRFLELPASTEGSALEWLKAEGREPTFDDVRAAIPDITIRTTQAQDVAQTLEKEVAQAKSGGLIIGRKARSEQASAIRLGSVARRVLRRLHQPVTVVPPDWRRASVPTGPVLVAVDLQDESIPALKHALKFAHDCGREVLAVHVARDVDRYFHYARSNERLESLRQRLLEDLRGRTRTWLDEHGAHDATPLTVLGDTAERVLHMSVEHKALLVVCGSRGLSLPERMLQASVGSTVAAFAPCPVMIVAPH